MKRLFTEKLALIPNTKIVITDDLLGHLWANNANVCETLELCFSRDSLLATMLEHLEKRWQTLDLISVMQEVNRTLHRFSGRENVTMRENLSCIPRLQKVDKSLGQVVSKQEWIIPLAYNPFPVPGLSPPPLPIPQFQRTVSPTGLSYGAIFLIMAHMEKFRPKGVPLSGFRYMKG